MASTGAPAPPAPGGTRRRVLLIVVDGCTPRLLKPALASGELQCLSSLAAAGSLDLDCTTVFPSITPAATASIITGRHPSDHGIAGMSWFNADSGEVSYFGDDVATVLGRGPADFLCSFLTELNGDRLRAPTLMQTATRHGLGAASFNYLIFRGDVRYEARTPGLLRLLPFMPRSVSVFGPPLFCLGEFVQPPDPLELHHRGVGHRFGLDDAGTEDFLVAVGDPAQLPAFSVAYFADYDFEAHRTGPEQATAVLRELDARLQRVLDAWGGLARVLDQLTIVITADHGHSDVRDDDTAAIGLDARLEEFHPGSVVTGWRDDDAIMICPNMRAAQIYVRHGDRAIASRVTASLLQDERNDQVMWRERTDEAEWYYVQTATRGALRFRRGNGGGVRDQHGSRWSFEGDLTALDGGVSAGELHFEEYPNAFERIAGGLGHDRAGHIWVTARPGFEYAAPGQRPHPGAGSHGTLHASDSCVPLLIAGEAPLPARPARIVDVEPFCRRLLGLPPVSG